MSQGLSLHRAKRPHRELMRRYRHFGKRADFRASVALSICLFFVSVAVSFFAIQYATERASNSVTDIILSNTPALDIDWLFVYSTLTLIAFITLLLLAHPKRIPFTLYALTLFFLIRSCFTSLTHLGPFPTATINAADWGTVLGRFLFSSDLFFSAHTGVPFLMALIFWRERNLRALFILWSFFMAAIVLAGHYHYTIDVLSAFFITYTIFHIAEWMFPADRAFFYTDVPVEFE